MISVCMATYNGASFIVEQIDSILKNISIDDELIISDDGSTDATCTLIKQIMERDSRVKLVKGPQKGIIANFENAIVQAKGEFIFLSDQDDVWCEDKVSTVLKSFEDKNTMVVVHDSYVVNEKMQIIIPSYFDFRKSAPGVIKNIVKNTFVGCCMAFRRNLLSYALPIPRNIEMHDQWLGICGELNGDVRFIKDKLIYYRRHGENSSSLSKHHPLIKMIRNRLLFIKSIILRSFYNS